MNRRRWLIGLGACAFPIPFGALAQQPARKLTRIGVLGLGATNNNLSRLDAFRSGLREIGYIEGQNLLLEVLWADGKYERLPALAEELVARKVDVLVTSGAVGSMAAKKATSTIPIVMAGIGDAVAAGLVASEAHPGGNITGLSLFNPEVNAKRLELLKEAFPRIRRIGFLFNPDNYRAKEYVQPLTELAASTLKLELQASAISSPEQFESAFATMKSRKIDAVSVYDDPILVAAFGKAADLARKYRLPTVGNVDIAEAGALMGYGVNGPAVWRRAATLVNKIVSGVKPAEIPIERATTFELVVNQRTARAIGVTVPKSILLRADKVIE